jgi:hypothetical protein
MILFLCWVIIAQCRAEDLPICYEDYLSILNGHFDNIEQWGEYKMHDKVVFKGKPVLIPGLQKDPVLYYEEVMNGNLYRRNIIVRNASSTDNRLYVTYYNFTDLKQYKPGTFNTDGMANFTLDDFLIDGGCQETFTQQFPGVLFGEYSDCRHVVNGRHPVYTTYLSCDTVRFEPPLAAAEKTSLMAYALGHKGPRYPLINSPEGYVNPCKDGL